MKQQKINYTYNIFSLPRFLNAPAEISITRLRFNSLKFFLLFRRNEKSNERSKDNTYNTVKLPINGKSSSFIDVIKLFSKFLNVDKSKILIKNLCELIQNTYKASSELRPVNAYVGTCSSRLPSSRRLFRLVNGTNETLFIVVIEFPDNCLNVSKRQSYK